MDSDSIKVLDIDSSEENNPIRKLNVDYDLPVEIGKKLIGKTERETSYNVELFRQSLDKIIHTHQQNYGVYLCHKIHDDVIASVKEILNRCFEQLTPVPCMAILSMLSNMIGSTMEKLCKSYKHNPIDMKAVNEAAINHEDIDRCGVKYRIGDKLKGYMIPYGWNKDDNGTLYTNPDETVIIYTIFELVYNGTNYHDIANYLNEKKLFSRNDVKWESQMVKEIVHRGIIL